MSNSRSFSILKPLNEDKIVALLKLDKVAKEDGEKNLPAKTAKDLSGFERKILNEAQKHHAKIRMDVQRDRAMREKELAEHSTRLMGAAVVPQAQARFRELQLEIDNQLRDLNRARKELIGKERVLKDFAEPRNIFDAPPANSNWFFTFALLVVGVLIEAVLNMLLFAEGNEFGLLGGVMIAAGISGMNVFGFFSLGYFGVRYKNCKFLWQKLSGFLLLILSLLTMIAFHSIVAFYRQISVRNPEIDTTIASKQAFSRFLTFDFVNLDLASMALLVLGCALGLIALVKGITYRHPVPGFERRYNNVIDAEMNLGDIKHDFKETFVDGTEEIIDKLKIAISAQGDYVRRYQQLHDDITNFERRYDQLERDLLSSTRHLIDRYRLENRKARSEPQPNYFETPFNDASYFQTEPHNPMVSPAEIQSRAQKDSDSAQALLVKVESEHTKLRALLLEDANGAP